jgi:WD40 repeat protein
MGERITAIMSKKEYWDAVTGATLRTLEGHSHWVDAVVFSPDGRLLASGSGNHTVRLWGVTTGATLRTLGWVVRPLIDSACDRPPKDAKDKNMGVAGPTKPWSPPVSR